MKPTLQTFIFAFGAAMLLVVGSTRAATIDLASATATVNQGGFDISNTLSDNGAGWATLAGASTGVYTTTSAINLFDSDGTLTFSLDHANSCCGSHELGHFRLSATGDAAPSVASSWTVLTPTSAVSSGAGESFIINPGAGPAGSVVLQSPNGARPLYTVAAPVNSSAFAGGITGFRLEALKVPGNGLSGNGPGTSTNSTPGNFVLTNFSVDLAYDASPFSAPSSIAVANHSFEADGSPASFTNGVPSDWQLGNGAGGGGLMGGLRPELIPRPDGTDTQAWSNGQDIFQVTGETIAADTLYTLTVDLGARSDLDAPAELRLGAGGVFGADLLDGMFLSDPTPARGSWTTWEYSVFVDQSSALIGQLLRIELIANGVQPQFDNVRLSAQSLATVPEPATATLALFGLGGLVMRRRRNAA